MRGTNGREATTQEFPIVFRRDAKFCVPTHHTHKLPHICHTPPHKPQRGGVHQPGVREPQRSPPEPKFRTSPTTKKGETALSRSPPGRRLPTLPEQTSTIGAGGLNFSVRDGKRWIPRAMAALVGFMEGRAISPAGSHGKTRERPSGASDTDGVAVASVCLVPRGSAPAETPRVISTARLWPSRALHLRPIDVIVCDGPVGRSNLGGGFALRCFQRLSWPDAATRRCPWRDNRRTGGRSNTVLSY